jgi:hypothetical protein
MCTPHLADGYGRGCAMTPPMMHASSVGRRHTTPSFQIAMPQHCRRPPARDVHPLPSHTPHLVAQQTDACAPLPRTPLVQTATALCSSGMDGSGTVIDS